MQTSSDKCLVLTIAALGLFVPPAAARGAFTFSTVALSDAAAPGAGDGVKFDTFTSPVLSPNGKIAFTAGLKGTGVDATNNQSVYAGTVGALQLAVRSGAQGDPNDAQAKFESFDPIAINNGGRIAFRAKLTGTGVDDTNDQVIWSGALGSLALAARTGAAAPGAGDGVKFTLFTPGPRYNAQNQMSFDGNITPDEDEGVWAGTPGAITAVAISKMQAADLPDGVKYGTIASNAMNDNGRLVVSGTITGTGVTNTNNFVIWTGAPGALKVFVRSGDAAPGAGDGTTFGFFTGFPKINNAGQVAFTGFLRGPGGEERGWSAYAGAAGALNLIAKQGTQAPNLANGVQFLEPFQPLINGSGKVVLATTLQGTDVDATNDFAVYAGAAGGLKLVAREGDQAAGAPAGVTFGDSFNENINAAGLVAMMCNLRGVGVDETNDNGIWATLPSGELQLVVREGSLFDVGGGVMRTIDQLGFAVGAGGEDGGNGGFDSTARLAFRATFTDGSSGVFITQVPEPGTAVLTILIGALASGRRRFRRST